MNQLKKRIAMKSVVIIIILKHQMNIFVHKKKSALQHIVNL